MMRAKWCTTNLGYGVDGGCVDACTVCILDMLLLRITRIKDPIPAMLRVR
jgi:hypothetical protein